MAADDCPYDDPSLKGMERYFNSTTIRGRKNVTLATYSFIAACFITGKLLMRSKPSDTNQTDSTREEILPLDPVSPIPDPVTNSQAEDSFPNYFRVYKQTGSSLLANPNQEVMNK